MNTPSDASSNVDTGGRLDDRVLRTLTSLPGRVAFNGLRRVLGVHPESLSRALRRLERDGAVERTAGGYRLREPAHAPSRDADAQGPRVVAEVQLAPTVRTEDVITPLAGRWFGNLRWVGLDERPEAPRLAWSPRSGPGQVLLEVRHGTLRVMVDGAADEEAAYELLAHALPRFRSQGSNSSNLLTLAADEPGPVDGLN